MDEYWKALIRGLTPETKQQANLWLAAPAFILFAMVCLWGMSHACN